MQIRRVVHPGEADIRGLAELLIECVRNGASISFMLPIPGEKALAFWRGVTDGVHSGGRLLFVAEDGDGIIGTVQVILNLPENQPHRVDVAKLMVHPRARRMGVAAALMQTAEGASAELGRTLMVLDTVTGSAASRLYERLGWKRAGDIPGFALDPHGGLCSTTFYYRNLVPVRDG
nr:GNAT family N-acetyltransferase [Caulifigura coniformis]